MRMVERYVIVYLLRKFRTSPIAPAFALHYKVSGERFRMNRVDTVFPEEKDCIMAPVF